MSGGGSEVTSSNPWSQAQPYLLDAMGKAQGLYNTTSPQYANPASNFGYGQVTGALGGAINGTNGIGSLSNSLNPAVGSAISSELSGTPDYTAVNKALDAANQQTWNSFNNTEIPQLNQRASFLGNPSGAIKDLNWATSQIGNNMNLNAQQAYLGQYNDALARQASAAGLGANIAQTAGAQSLQGASLFPSIAQMPQQNLADYASLISGTGGKFGSGSLSMDPGAAGTAANIIGGLTAGTGLLNQLTGANPSTGGLIGTIGRFFSNDPTTGTAGAQDAANIASGWAAGNTDAGDLATASNQQWLDSLGNDGTSDSGGGGGGGGAGSAVGIAATVAPKAYSALTASAPAASAAAAPAAAEAAPAVAAPAAEGASTAAAAPSGGLSSGAGAAVALLPLAITAELAMHTHGVQLGDAYWQKFKNPTGSYGTDGNYTQNFLQLANGINQGDIPPDYLVAQYPGLYQAAAQMRSLGNTPISAYWGRGGTGPNVSRLRA